MALRLSTQLRYFGSDLSAADFRDILIDAKEDLFPSWTDEDLSYTRDEADQYCDLVRRRTGTPFPRQFILRQLNNVRKHPVKV